jgi:PKD repeat protein/murein tripeptide amidase MpaA
MKARPFLVAALPAALLLCNAQVTDAAPASSTRHAHGSGGDESYIVIRYRDQAELQRVAARFQHLDVDKRARTAKVEVDAQQMDELRRMGVRFDIDRNGTMKLRSFYQHMRAGRFGARAISGYTCYRTVEETHDAMAALQTSKPALATVLNIGPSWRKSTSGGTNYEMRALRITNSATNSLRPNKPAMVLLSSIHAREYTPAELNMRFGEWLVNNYGTNAEATWLLDNYVFYLIPQGNPDGRKIAEGGTSWRKNVNTSNGTCPSNGRYGVDLNRNYPFRWNTVSGGSSGNACDDTYRGPTAGSEPETQNVLRLIAGTRGASGSYSGGIFADGRPDDLTTAAADTTTGLFIDLHSSGGDVLWPWGMNSSLAPNGTALQTLGRRMAFFNGHDPYQSSGLYPTDGATDDTMYGLLGVPSYTFELGTQFFETCTSFTGTVLPRNLDALRYAARNLSAPYRFPTGPNTVSVSASSTSVAAGTPVTISAVLNDSQFKTLSGTTPDPVHNITSARIYIDTPPWETGAGSGIAMSASDGSFNSSVETATASVSTTGLSVGRHIFYVQGTDASGKAGTPNAVLVNITSGGGGGNIAPVANFTVSTSSLTATFTDTSTDSDGSIASRSWNFGDGTTSTLANPTKTYAAAGTYTVTLTVTDNGGLTHTKTQSVTVSSGSGAQTYTNSADYTISDNATVESPITVSGRTGNAPSGTPVAVNIVHTYIGDLKVDLIAPDGSVYVLHNRSGGSADNINQTYTTNLSTEPLNGTWKLRVNDNAGGDTGYINSWSVTF